MKLPWISLGIAVALCAQVGYVSLRHFNSLSDIRTQELKIDGLDRFRVQRGRELMDRALAAQGGSVAWASRKTVETVFRDEWNTQKWMSRHLNPWPGNDLRVRFQAIVGTFNYRLEVLEGEKTGEVWGMQSFHTYHGKGNEPVRFERFEQEGIPRNLLAAVFYFEELTFRLSRAPLVAYAGNRFRNGQSYDLVFSTWEKAEPHEQHDQYIAWINTSTGLLEMAEWTFRGALPSYVGVIHYQDFRDVGGVKLPFELWIVPGIESGNEDFIHRVLVESMEFDTVARETLLPDKSLPYYGDQKPEG